MDKATIKQVVISIFVGACIAFITTLLQGLLDYIRVLPEQITGVAGGMVYFLKVWRTNQIA